MSKNKDSIKDKNDNIKVDESKKKDNLFWLESENIVVDEPVWLDD